MALEGHRTAQEARVHDEVHAARDEPRRGHHELLEPFVAAEVEDCRRREAGEREGADVEEELVDRRAPRAPLHRRGGDGERQRRLRAGDRGSGQRTDRADGDRASVELEGERLAAGDERDDRQQAEDLGRRSEDEAERAGGDAADADETTRLPSPRESETNRGLPACGDAAGARSRSARRRRRPAREPGGPGGGLRVEGLVRHRSEAHLAAGRGERRLRAGVQDAVSALELGAVDGEIGLMDELVRVVPSAGKAATPNETVALIGSLDVSTSNRSSATARRIRSAMAKASCGVVSGRMMANSSPPNRAGTSLWRRCRWKTVGDPVQHGVAGQMPVRVVDVAQEVEVGHDHRERRVRAARAVELLAERAREVPGVEEAGLRVEPSLLLQRRDAQRAVDEEERGHGHRQEQRVPVPEPAKATPRSARTKSVERLSTENRPVPRKE